MKKCGYSSLERLVRPFVASRIQQGGNVGWVVNEFPNQLRACRQRERQKRARTLLVVLADADELSIEQRRRQLADRVVAAGYEALTAADPASLLIPKRHIETWIAALLGEAVTEDQDCKTRKKPEKHEIGRAAETLFEWSRPNAAVGSTCVPSLTAALPEWRKIG